jgi:hypothetical protein
VNQISFWFTYAGIPVVRVRNPRPEEELNPLQMKTAPSVLGHKGDVSVDQCRQQAAGL